MTARQVPLLDPAPMRFTIDSWDTGYGSAMEVEGLRESDAATTLDIERPENRWTPIDPDPATPAPEAVLFVDGVRRIDARVWIEDRSGTGVVSGSATTSGICASYAAGVVCCCAGRAHVAAAHIRRGMFTITEGAADIHTRAGIYQARKAQPDNNIPLQLTLSAALQQHLTDTEIHTAATARSGASDHDPIANDLLVIDGPLRGRAHLERAVGYIKSHQTEYLPAELNAMIATLTPGQRTPVFLMGTSWVRYSWYLRLPGPGGAPWAGVVRLEAAPQLSPDTAISLANLTQSILGRFASEEYKDSRAPQNLYPIAGLERHLRHRLGDQQFIYRALRAAAGR
ncbi:MAG TPA: hypothetical protein VHX38_14110 [Pseudonocardiaceae bacterium]|nr:hypothetical protein [Pseudonocardiaceae bacterium]